MRSKRKLSPWCKEAHKAKIDKDMTSNEIAEKLNISRVYLCNILSGKTVPSHELLVKICDLLEIACPEDDNSIISL